MATACLSSISRDGKPAGFFDFLAQEKIQSGAQNDDGGELADFVPAGRDRCAQDVGGKLEFKRERKPAAEFKPDILLIGHRRCVIGCRCGRAPTKQHSHGSGYGLCRCHGDDQGSGSLDDVSEVDRQVLKEDLHHPLTADARVRGP